MQRSDAPERPAHVSLTPLCHVDTVVLYRRRVGMERLGGFLLRVPGHEDRVFSGEQKVEAVHAFMRAAYPSGGQR